MAKDSRTIAARCQRFTSGERHSKPEEVFSKCVEMFSKPPGSKIQGKGREIQADDCPDLSLFKGLRRLWEKLVACSFSCSVLGHPAT
jgi:hypothetical protein